MSLVLLASTQAAFEGSTLASCVLARAYRGIQPSISQMKAIIEAATTNGDPLTFPNTECNAMNLHLRS
jgi:hypothetical protein